jgi:PhnB protein
MSPYLNFDGNCEAALAFYESVLGARRGEVFRFAGTPMAEHVPAEWQQKIMHASLTLEGQELMASDTMPGRYEKPQGISLSLHPKDTAEAERVFASLSEGGTVVMPLEKTFWAARFGVLVDRFGIPWMVNCDEPQS